MTRSDQNHFFVFYYNVLFSTQLKQHKPELPGYPTLLLFTFISMDL